MCLNSNGDRMRIRFNHMSPVLTLPRRFQKLVESSILDRLQMNHADLSGDGFEGKCLCDSETMATATTEERFAVPAHVNVDASELPHSTKFNCRQVSAARRKVLN